MFVVSNTAPILNLAIIGRMGLMRSQFSEILIPTAVFNELKTQGNRPGTSEINEGLNSGFLKTASLVSPSLYQVLMHDLDSGEAQAIALAVERKADLVLLDEKEGRKHAKKLGLKVTGILGILMEAYHRNEILSLSQVIEDLRKKAGFRLSEDVIKVVISEAPDRLE